MGEAPRTDVPISTGRRVAAALLVVAVSSTAGAAMLWRALCQAVDAGARLERPAQRESSKRAACRLTQSSSTSWGACRAGSAEPAQHAHVELVEVEA